MQPASSSQYMTSDMTYESLDAGRTRVTRIELTDHETCDAYDD